MKVVKGIDIKCVICGAKDGLGQLFPKNPHDLYYCPKHIDEAWLRRVPDDIIVFPPGEDE